MNTKDLIIKELEATPEPLLNEILDFVRLLKVKQTQEAIENQQDIEDSYQALTEVKDNKQNKYNFSNLKKLSWKGDAVKAQRQLRDEW